MEGLLPAAPAAAVERARARLQQAALTLQNASTGKVAPELARLGQIPDAIAVATANAISRQRQRLDSAAALLEVLSPAATLRRGYSITRANGAVVTSAAAITAGTVLETTFADGTVKSTALPANQ